MYLGIDLGTSGLRALLIDDGQKIVGSASAGLTVSRPHPGWSEQHPADWVAACGEAIATLRASCPKKFAALRGIGLSGQMHGATLYDAGDEVLRPSILWNDGRAWREAAELDDDPRFRAVTGNIVFPGFTAPKLVWIARHEPGLFRRVASVLLPKDALRLWLTGDHVTDMSDAAGTAWLDMRGRDWSDELLAATGLSRHHMPRLVEGVHPSGVLRPALAAQWGLSANVVVAGGAGDNAAAAVGMGVVREGQAFVSLGTSGVLFAAGDTFRPRPQSAVHAFCHALPGRWHQMGVILSAADALNWYAGLTGQSPAALDAEIGAELHPPGPVSFLPYLSGERTPHNDAAIRGAFIGLGHEAGRIALTRAVMEGVAFALADNLDALRAAGTKLERVVAVGGGSRSHYWLKTIATALDLPVDVPAQGETGAAFGAARLGLIAATGADPLTACAPVPIERTVAPVSGLRDAYDEALARFRTLYRRISG